LLNFLTNNDATSGDVAYYLDTSAFLKLIVEEEHSAAMYSWVVEKTPVLASSDLLRVEALRATRRHSSESLARAREWIAGLVTIQVTAEVCERAAELDPSILRSLDALHLATALQLGDDLQGVVTYDERLAAACRQHGVSTLAPL
jgi:uncharacterized protein